MTLPTLVTPRTKYLAGTVVLLLTAGLYAATNRLQLGTPTPLPLTAVDQAVPLMSWAVWVYAAYPLLFVLTFVFEHDARRLDRWMWATLFVNVASNAVFVVWPTTLDRAAFAPPSDAGPWTTAVLEWFRALDAPTNCFPSLHVSTAYLSSFVAWRRDWRRFALAFAWANAIALSTLSTKQHYLVDVVAGFGLAVVAYVLFMRKGVDHHG